MPFKKGDIVKVFQKVTEGKRERLVPFGGRVLQVKGSNENIMFTVRQILEGVAVDRIFPFRSPTISKIEVLEDQKKKAEQVRKVRTSPKAKAARGRKIRTTKLPTRSSKAKK